MIRKQSAVLASDEESKFLKVASEDFVQALLSFAAALAQSETLPRAKEVLSGVIRHADKLGLKRVIIADACDVTEATVSRWAAGTVIPHVLIARAAIKAIYEWALKEAERCKEEMSKTN